MSLSACRPRAPHGAINTRLRSPMRVQHAPHWHAPPAQRLKILLRPPANSAAQITGAQVLFWAFHIAHKVCFLLPYYLPHLTLCMMHLRHSSDPSLEIYTPRGCTVVYSTRNPFEPGKARPPADPVVRLTRECSALRLRLATAERRERSSPYGPLTAPAESRTPPSARFELSLETAYARRDAARSHIQIEIMKLAERYKALQETLREMQETLRTKDKEIEALRQERDRLVAERDQARVEGDKARTERDQERMKNQRAPTPMAPTTMALTPVAPIPIVPTPMVHTPMENGVGENREQNGAQFNNRRRGRTPSRSRGPRRIENAPPPPPPPPPPVPQKPQAIMDAEQIARTRSMDVFMTKTDNWSGAQVIQSVEDLNAEINHFAASATETCAFAKRTKTCSPPPSSDTGPLQDEESASWLGAAFVQALSTRDHTQDPILVQLALQSSIAICCARSLSLFCVGFPSKLDALLSRVLTHMQDSGMCDFFVFDACMSLAMRCAPL